MYLPCGMQSNKLQSRIVGTKKLFDAGYIKSFNDLFILVARTTIATHLKIGNARMKRLVENPQEFPAEKIKEIADYFGIDVIKLTKLIMRSKK